MKKRICYITTALCLVLCIVLCIAFAAVCSKAENSKAVLPEVRNNGTAIQWRDTAEEEWHDLVALDTLRGAVGENGKDGADGKNGINGTDGKNGIDGKNGTNGKNGLDGKDGTDGKNGPRGAGKIFIPRLVKRPYFLHHASPLCRNDALSSWGPQVPSEPRLWM